MFLSMTAGTRHSTRSKMQQLQVEKSSQLLLGN